MNAGPAQAACPRCGRVTGVRTLPEILAELGRQGGEARRGHAGNPPQRPSPASRPGQDDYTLGDDQGDSGLPGQGLADIGAAVAAEVLRRTVGRAVKKHYQERVVPQLQRRDDELRRRQLERAQRYPDLRYCVDDRVLFLTGCTRTLPLEQFLITDQPDAFVACLRAP
jgi:hypothetical protein